MNVVWNQTETSMFLNNTVAIKLMHGHMIQTIIHEIARVITIGRSVGCTKRKASLCAKESTTSSSKKKATGHMIIISWKASKKTWFVIPPIFNEMLKRIMTYTIKNDIIAVNNRFCLNVLGIGKNAPFLKLHKKTTLNISVVRYQAMLVRFQ